MCPRCEGMGASPTSTCPSSTTTRKSLNEGAITVPGYTAGGWNFRLYGASGFFDPDKPIRDYTKAELHDFLHREPARMKIAGINMTYEGLIPRIQKSILAKDKEAMQPHIRALVDRAVTFTACPDCGGTRLNEGACSSRIGGSTSPRPAPCRSATSPHGSREPRRAAGSATARSARQTLKSFVEIGLGYLSLTTDGHAVGRRGTAHRADPPARLLANGRHLRLRRAHHGPAPP